MHAAAAPKGSSSVMSSSLNKHEQGEQRRTQLASFPEANPNPVIEVDAAGSPTYLNPAARVKFPSLSSNGTWHPILEGITSLMALLHRKKRKFLTREIKVDDAMYDQKIAIIPGSGGTRIYMNDITERKGREDILQDLAAQLQIANARLERLVVLDPLTELLNRRGLQQILSREIRWNRRYDSHLVVLLVDLDNFKRINDTLGHAVGDGVLKAVAHKLQASVRTTDYVARIGGDEFMILLPHTHFAEGMQVAEHVRRAISGAPMVLSSGVTVKVTASFGVEAIPQAMTSIDELLAKTHLALHRSKQAGKDRVSNGRRSKPSDDGGNHRQPTALRHLTAVTDIESRDGPNVLKGFGMRCGQGFLLGRPR